ncbi:MAG: hypothetical protein RL095_671 [Verrucomicrobiota bacterium]|jgi:6-phosphogluconolactonase
MFIGTYNRPGAWFTAHGEGLLSCSFDAVTGTITRRDAFVDIANPTYLAWAADGRLLAATDHYMEPGAVHAFAVNAEGELQQLSSADAQGQAVCHVCGDRKGKVYVASYMDGRLTVHDLDAEGWLSPAVQVFRYAGTGPNAARQEAAHAHQAVLAPDGRHLYVPDLGADCVWVHGVDAHGRLNSTSSSAVAPGSGPRHLVFHPSLSLAYLIGELDGVVRVLSRDPLSGALSQIAAHPGTGSAVPGAAAIRLHPSGKILAASERSDATISFFAVAADGSLSFAARLACGGKTPRDFAFDPSGRWLLCACQDSDRITVHELDAAGLPSGRRGPDFPCGSPVNILF